MPRNYQPSLSWACTACVGKSNCCSRDSNRYCISIPFHRVKGRQPKAGSWRVSLLLRWRSASCSPQAHFPPGATNCDPIPEQNPRTHSPWSRFRMTLWAMRGAVLGKGPWLLIRENKNLDLLRNSSRKRRLVSHDLYEQMTLFKRGPGGPPHFNVVHPPRGSARVYPGTLNRQSCLYESTTHQL